ncbi:hypothetical protein GXM_09387 [Nostoc sphaeroides CCNUC1]|uniref:Uncharacterized protein n=1 Tax=Nostoc sphaeroides CCNUC1 TaxID=2653204 RepID=A0A5P8WGC3_9NOSO|nr:hypothetical protein GXM_09387 [Nostoc sphaeroides CCNUC1]
MFWSLNMGEREYFKQMYFTVGAIISSVYISLAALLLKA